MPQGYLIKQLEHYQSGERNNDRMYIMASLSQLLPPEVTEIAILVNQAMLDVMVAGATGEF